MQTIITLVPYAPLLVLGLLGGAWLLIAGWFPRRIGTTPFCRRCRYNLTGLTTNRCPECGSNISAKTTIVGVRRRRYSLLAAGLLFVFTSGVPLVALSLSVALDVDWYERFPTIWITRDLKSAQPQTVSRAKNVLTRRHAFGELSSRQIARIADICLAEQRRETAQASSDELLRFLFELYVSNNLKRDQLAEFVKGVLQPISLDARPRVHNGRRCAIRIPLRSRAPSGDLWVGAKIIDIRLDGRALRFNADSFVTTGQRDDLELSYALPITGRGRHTIAADIEVSLYHGGRTARAGGPPAQRSRRTFSAPVEVVADDIDLSIPLRRSAELDAAVARATRITGVHIYSVGGPTETSFAFNIEFAPDLPIGLAFDIIVQSPAGERVVGSITAEPAAAFRRSERIYADIPGPATGQSQTIQLRLRASSTIAQQSPTLFEIWGGDLLIDVSFEGEGRINRTFFPIIAP